MRTIFFFEKPLVKNTFFKSFPQKTLRLWISTIRICIWSEESTLSVDFMDSWSVFGYAPKKFKIRFWIFPKKRTLTSMPLLMESVRKVIADCVEYLRPWRRNQHWYLKNRSREPGTSTVFYRYDGHIELIRFKEYYRMPRGHEHISFVFSSAFQDIFS